MLRVATGVLALLLLALPGSVLGEAASAERVCVEQAIAGVQNRYHAIRDLEARFEQTMRSVALGGRGGGAASISRGTVVFQKPGRMRWSYEEPEASLVVSDGTTLWLFDPAAREAQRFPVGDAFLSAAAIQFLLGEGDILRDFDVSSEVCGDEGATLHLVPRAPATYEKLRIRTDAATGDVVETVVFDLFGNETAVAFAAIRVNLDPSADVFTFDPPDGVEVLELEPLGGPGKQP